jgi:hypothetical protein
LLVVECLGPVTAVVKHIIRIAIRHI